jgi:hypothetical protein
MEEQERVEGEDVEGHRRKAADFPASEGAGDEADGEGDDVEAHQLRRPPTDG